MRANNVKGYTDKQLLDKVKSLQNFKEIPKEYWILGVQSIEDEYNVFDDKFYLFKGEKFIMVTSGTTNPGASALQNYQKYNSKGAFVIKTNWWHYGLWSFGYHNSKMPALKQKAEVIGFRDGNKDNKSEQIGEEVKGKFGINFHTVSYNHKTSFWRRLIGGWSAGCQVINDVDDYYKILNLVKYQEEVSYCIIQEF